MRPPKPGTTIYWARLQRQAGIPPLAEVVEAKYLRPKKKLHSHDVQPTGNQFPLPADIHDLFTTPHAAESRLLAMVKSAIQEHITQIDQLYEALHGFKQNALIDWTDARKKPPQFLDIIPEKFMPPTEPTIVKSVANFQQAIATQASRRRANAGLIVNAQRAALKNAGNVQKGIRPQPGQINAELTAELPILLPRPEEPATPDTLPNQTPPIEPPNTGTIPPTPDEDDLATTPRVHAKPKRLFKGTPNPE